MRSRVSATRPITAGLIAAAVLAMFAAAGVAKAANTVTVLAPADVNAAIVTLDVEDFEDVDLVPGLSITFATWRNSANAITANGPVTYSGTLPLTWTPTSDAITNNTWDGTRALVNGWGFNWAYPYAASVTLSFSPPRPRIGIGCSNFQGDVTSHTVLVNGVSLGSLESRAGWVDTIIHGKNGYLVFEGDPISSIEFRANTHFDGLVFDRLALTPQIVPVAPSTWGRLKALYR